MQHLCYRCEVKAIRLQFYSPARNPENVRAGDALDKAVSWCKDQQLEFDAVNDNLPAIVEMYGNNSRKITCDWYIDDKAVLPAMVMS